MILRIEDIRALMHKVGIKAFLRNLVNYLQEDFSHWDEFQKSARYAAYADHGVLELMPVCGKDLFSFKYVNGHPNNPQQQLMTVVALGMLADVKSGYPLMLSEMTILTALRTAATAALSSKLMARRDSKKLAIIGCGAQSEFQVLAHHAIFDLSEVHYFDLDPQAMDRFATHLQGESFKLIPATDTLAAIQKADIIVTTTAARGKKKVLVKEWLQPGQHICGMGGDAPGKTELDPAILTAVNKIVIEYFPQTSHEGEIQNLGNSAREHVYAELWELCAGTKAGRNNPEEITLFDGVGFALEDYSILRYVYTLAKEYALGLDVDLVPQGMQDPKNLFGLLV